MSVTPIRMVMAMAAAMVVATAGGCGKSETEPGKPTPPATQPAATPDTPATPATPDAPATPTTPDPAAGSSAAPAPAPAPAKAPRTTYLGQALDKAEQVRDQAAEHDKAILDATK